MAQPRLLAKIAAYSMEVHMARKVSIIALGLLILASGLSIAPASAVVKVSNGVACVKAGATTKVSGASYVCAKNPIVKNAKLTWLSIDCINTTKTYSKAFASLPLIKSTMTATVAGLDKDLVALQAQQDKSLTLIPGFTQKIADLTAKMNILKADTVLVVRYKSSIDTYAGAIKSYEAAIKAYGTIPRAIARTTLSKTQAQAQYTNAQTDVKGVLEMAKLICTKGY